MKFKKRKIKTSVIKIEVIDKKITIGHAYLYLIYNDLHQRPYGLMEDVYIDEKFRGKGIGSKLIKEIIKTAKKYRCYKLIGTSRYNRPYIHKFYKNFGFKEHGIEFRMDFFD